MSVKRILLGSAPLVVMMLSALMAEPQSRSPTHLIVVAVAALPWSILFAMDAPLDRLRDIRLRVVATWAFASAFFAQIWLIVDIDDESSLARDVGFSVAVGAAMALVSEYSRRRRS